MGRLGKRWRKTFSEKSNELPENGPSVSAEQTHVMKYMEPKDFAMSVEAFFEALQITCLPCADTCHQLPQLAAAQQAACRQIPAIAKFAKLLRYLSESADFS